jgi:hypothetical protein
VCAILLVELVQPQMAITFEAVVELHPWCHGGPEGAGDAAEWVDEAVVEYVGDGLFLWLKIDSQKTRFASRSAAYLARIGNDQRHTNTPTTPNTSTANLSRVICFSTGSTNIVRIGTGHCIQSRLGYIFCFSLSHLNSQQVWVIYFPTFPNAFPPKIPAPSRGCGRVDDERSTTGSVGHLASFVLDQSKAAD